MLKFLNKIFQIFIDFLVFIITILILFSLYKLIIVKVYHKPYANTLGYSIFEIATGSMEPTLKVKDLIIVKITKNIKENDIITYQEENALITHRVIKINDQTITTKGDANNSIDVKINKEDIVGKVVYIIPNGGLIRELFLTPKIIISSVITLILISICLTISQKKENNNSHTKTSKKSPKITIDINDSKKDNKIKQHIKEDNINDTKSFQNLKEEIFKAEENKKKKK